MAFAASSARPCGEERRRWPRPWCRGLYFFLTCSQQPTRRLWALQCPQLRGQDVWSQLISCTSHTVTAPLRGLPPWHSRTSGRTETSNAVLLLCVFVGSLWSPNVENEFWESYLRFLEAAALPAFGHCCNTLIRRVLPRCLAAPAPNKVWRAAGTRGWVAFAIVFCEMGQVTPSSQSGKGWQAEGISLLLSSYSSFLKQRDNNSGWIQTGPNSQAPKHKISSRFASTIVLFQTG